MIISLEGLGITSKECFTNCLVGNKTQLLCKRDRVICCPPVPLELKALSFRRWMYVVTRSTELWREATAEKSESITIFENSPFSVPCYVQALVAPLGDVEQQEYELIVEIIAGLSELMTPPDIIVLFEPDVSGINELQQPFLLNIHQLLVEWAENHTAKVVYIPSYQEEGDWELWYNQALQKVLDTIEVTA